MAEHTRGQDSKHQRDNSSGRTVGDIDQQNTSTEKNTNSSLDEKSSGIGRREKNTGAASKDGLTGSDLDGQVTR